MVCDQQLEKLNHSKAAGPDGVGAVVLKTCAVQLRSPTGAGAEALENIMPRATD